jgi:hypothetical protein
MASTLTGAWSCSRPSGSNSSVPSRPPCNGSSRLFRRKVHKHHKVSYTSIYRGIQAGRTSASRSHRGCKSIDVNNARPSQSLPACPDRKRLHQPHVLHH